MQRGLEGRRIAVFAHEEGDAIRAALEAAGADVQLLSATPTLRDEDWHSARYAALVVGSCEVDGRVEPKLLQLLREFLVSDKPVAIVGGGRAALEQAGATPEDAIIETDPTADVAAFSRQLAARLGGLLDERQVDDMSDQSFPASDPPGTTPASIGPADPAARDAEARP
jgi:putative intracellular protease/amidase